MSRSDTDIVICGAGLAGLTAGVAFGQAGLRVAVVDRAGRPDLTSLSYDGRTTAVAHGSVDLYRALGAWSKMANAAEPIDEIRISDGNAPVFLHFDHREVGDDPVGYIVENRVMRDALFRRIDELPSVRLVLDCGVAGTGQTGGGVLTTLDGGSEIVSRLLVGADGRASPRRIEAGIDTIQWRYGQKAIVCTARHERSHRGIAHERFLPAGPFAILPMRSDESDPDGLVHRSSIVWTEAADRAALLVGLPEERFVEEMTERFGGFMGRLGVTGPIFSYPLGLQIAQALTAERLALVGDAAHVIHPIAGQGFNLGLRDIAALAEVVVDASRLGLDIGSTAVLRDYEAWRRSDIAALAAITDGFNRLFSNDIPPVRLARDLGLGLVNKAPPLRRFFMRHAMGVLGDLPRLMRGEAL